MFRKPVLHKSKARSGNSMGLFQNARDRWTEALGTLPKATEKDKKGTELFLWVTLLLETCQLQFENTGQRYCAPLGANLDRK